MAPPHAQGQGSHHQDGQNIECDLMPGHRRGAKGGNEQGDHGNDQIIGQEAEPDGQSLGRQTSHAAPKTPCPGRRQGLARGDAVAPRHHHDQDGQRASPIGEGGGQAAPGHAHGRDPKRAEHQNVIQEGVGGGSGQGNEGHAPCQAAAFQNITQGDEQRGSGHSWGDPAQVGLGFGDQFRGNANGAQQGAGEQQRPPDHSAAQQGQNNTLDGCFSHSGGLPLASQMSQHGNQHIQEAEEKDQHGQPQGSSSRHRREGHRSQVTGHHGIGHAIGHLSQLRHRQRQGETQERTERYAGRNAASGTAGHGAPRVASVSQRMSCAGAAATAVAYGVW